MASIQLRLEPQPTFPAAVAISVAGHAEPATLNVTFKHRTKDALAKWLADAQPAQAEGTAAQAVSAEKMVMDCASAWDLPNSFDEKNIALLEQNYIGACSLIVQAYVQELSKARLGN